MRYFSVLFLTTKDLLNLLGHANLSMREVIHREPTTIFTIALGSIMMWYLLAFWLKGYELKSLTRHY